MDILREARPIGAQAVQRQNGGVDQIQALAHLLAQPAMGLGHQRRQQTGEHLRRAPSIGFGQGRAFHHIATQVIEPGRLALQSVLDRPQARRAEQLGIEHRNQMMPGGQLPGIRVRSQRFRQSVQMPPRKQL